MTNRNNFNLKNLFIVLIILVIGSVVINQFIIPQFGFSYNTGMHHGGSYWGRRTDSLGIFLSSLALVFAKVLWALIIIGLIVGFIMTLKKYLFNGEKPKVEPILEKTGIKNSSCPNCHQQLSADFNFCPNCKTSLKDTCNQCGRAQQRDWQCCPYCGYIK